MKRLPHIISNFAMTADGKVSTRAGTASGFTSLRDKRRLLEIRALGDAVLVGRGTAEKDNMSMTIPAADLRAERIARGQTEHPIRVLISNSGDLPPTLKVFTNTAAPTLIYSTERMATELRKTLRQHAEVRLFPGEMVPLVEMLADLRARHGVRTLICEGGPTLVKALLAEDLLDEMYVTIAPKIFGGATAATMTGKSGDFLPESRQFRLKKLFVENDEAYGHYVRQKARPASVVA